jgi:signal transduction histidine kinase
MNAERIAKKQGDWREAVAPLAGSLVHEIKNPLSTLNINAQLLLEDWKDAREPREVRTVKRLRVILGEIQRLEGIVQAFVRFTERHELLLKEGRLNDVVDELVELIGPEARRKGVQVRTRLDDTLEPFPFDRDLIKQVLLNLVLNAQHAMDPKGGGELIILTHREDGSQGRWAVLDVIDTGVGISERVRERVFELYFSTKEDGMGLGLAISRSIVEEHGGSISVQSELEKGSQFTIRLPMDLPMEQGSERIPA